MNINYRLTTIRQEQANLFNEFMDAEMWAKDNEQEPWLEYQITKKTSRSI